jgi:electron transport complex protein RnfB
MLSAILGLSLLALTLAALLVWVARRFPADSDPLVVEIETLLPQTQCAQCGYPGCRPYAEAIAQGDTEINRCPPGGTATIQALADLLGCEAKPLDESLGEEKPPLVAIIDEASCIGCKLCIQACPVDAILGAAKRMHTVIADECTGCELCIPPCPVDCIDLIPAPQVASLPNALKRAQRIQMQVRA